MKESRTYLENAERCAHLADLAPSQPAYSAVYENGSGLARPSTL
jgi:hypothetical protein